MIRIILFFSILLLPSFSKDIDKEIKENRAILENNRALNKQTQQKIDELSSEIKIQFDELSSINNKIKILNQVISARKGKLKEAEMQLAMQKENAILIRQNKDKIEQSLIDMIINNFSWSFALELASKESFDEIINSEIYSALAVNTKEEIGKLNKEFKQISMLKEKNEKEIQRLQKFIKAELGRKEAFLALQKKQEDTINSLEKKHIAYQGELKEIVKKQKSLSTLLSNLNILKKEEAEKQKKEQEKLALEKTKRDKQAKTTKQTTQQRLAKNIDIDVRMIGSSTSGIKISKYSGKKTIAPLKSYVVSKNFGKYYDPVYKIQLFNESIILKTKEREAKVYNVLDGKIVYAKKDSAMLENVVIIQHNNGLHTIYSHLDQISPTIKVGKWIKKGYVVGRVDNLLTFQVTKNSTHINPRDLF